jgi:alkaline phosphatase
MITDFLAFDDAVKVAVDYAKSNASTLVLVFPDHNTGAMSIGHEQDENVPGYTDTTVEHLIDPIKDASLTVQGLIKMFPDSPTPSDIRDAFVAYWGPWWNGMTDAQAQDIIDMGSDSYAISEYISAVFTVFGWTTHGHSGEDVPLWSYSKLKYKRPVGLFDNTDLANIVADAFNVHLNDSGAWEEYDDSVLDMADPNNPVAIVDGVQYPVSKDLKIDGSHVKNMSDITVWAPQSGKVYIPKK